MFHREVMVYLTFVIDGDDWILSYSCSAEMTKLVPRSASSKDMDTDSNSSVGVTAAMEGLSTIDMVSGSGLVSLDDDGVDAGAGESAGRKSTPTMGAHVKQIKPLLNVSSRYYRR